MNNNTKLPPLNKGSKDLPQTIQALLYEALNVTKVSLDEYTLTGVLEGGPITISRRLSGFDIQVCITYNGHTFWNTKIWYLSDEGRSALYDVWAVMNDVADQTQERKRKSDIADLNQLVSEVQNEEEQEG